jgi:hypothetical protein
LAKVAEQVMRHFGDLCRSSGQWRGRPAVEMPGEHISPDAAVMTTKIVGEGGIVKFDIASWSSPGRTVAIPASRCSVGIESGQIGP